MIDELQGLRDELRIRREVSERNVVRFKALEAERDRLRVVLPDLLSFFVECRASYIKSQGFGREVSELDKEATGWAMNKAHEMVRTALGNDA